MVSSFNAPSDELELADYLRILRRRWLWALTPVVVVCCLAIVLTTTQSARFTASAQVSVGNSAAQDAIGRGLTASGSAASRELSNEVDLASSDTVRQQVTDRLGLEPDIAISAADSSDAIRFTATAATADNAARFANTWAEVYVETKRREAVDSIDGAVQAFENDLAQLRVQRQQLRQPIDDLEDQLAGELSDAERTVLQAQLSRLQGDLQPELDLLDTRVTAVADNMANLELTSRLAETGTARIVQVAAPPRTAMNASLQRNLVLAAVIGLILGAAMALLVENLDRTVKNTDDVAAMGFPVLGGIPLPGRTFDPRDLPLATMHHPRTPVAEAYQKVRTSVEFALLGRPISSLLITSPDQEEGKTTSATNLAWAMSAVDHRVALIDVDFRRPRIHEVFGCEMQPGLSDALRSGIPLEQLAVRVGDRGSRNLVVLPTGTLPPNPGDFVASPSFTDLIRELEDQADLVILDAPPVGPVSDALSMSRYVDAVVVVARAGKTTRDELQDTMESLRQVGADVIGVCVVGVRPTGGDYKRYEPDETPSRGSGRTTGGGRGAVVDLRHRQPMVGRRMRLLSDPGRPGMDQPRSARSH